MQTKHLIFISLIFICLSIKAYKFICNGDGSDECGPCDEEHAARWIDPNIPVLVDQSVLPKGITKEDWLNVVQESFDAWNSVAGSNLRFFALQDEQNYRDFGANDSAHEIFWI